MNHSFPFTMSNMPAPRCPSIYRSPSEWLEWAQRHMEYTGENPYFIEFDTFKKSRLVKHLGDLEIDRTWKYLLYRSLTGRKHRTLNTYL
jgi:hypothetical protein